MSYWNVKLPQGMLTQLVNKEEQTFIASLYTLILHATYQTWNFLLLLIYFLRYNEMNWKTLNIHISKYKYILHWIYEIFNPLPFIITHFYSNTEESELQCGDKFKSSRHWLDGSAAVVYCGTFLSTLSMECMAVNVKTKLFYVLRTTLIYVDFNNLTTRNKWKRIIRFTIQQTRVSTRLFIQLLQFTRDCTSVWIVRE